jgi:hypothetical protein
MARGGRFGVITEDVRQALDQLAHADRQGPAPEQAAQLANAQQMADAAIGAGLSEDETQKLIVGVLERAGYRVLITSGGSSAAGSAGRGPRAGPETAFLVGSQTS